MWSTEQILEVTKKGIAQLNAKGYMDVDVTTLTALDDHLIVDLGKAIEVQNGEITINSPADIFFKTLFTQVGRIVIDTKSYQKKLPKLFVDPLMWGLVSEYVEIDLSEILLDEVWNPDGYINYTSPGGPEEGARIAAIEFGCYKPAVHATVYGETHGLMAPITIPTGEQLFTAFQRESQYTSFIAGVFNSVHNTIERKAELYALMTVSMMCAVAHANNNEINVLAEYKAAKPDTTITQATALQNPDFLRFFARRAADIKDNMQVFSALYNNHEHVTFTTDPNVIVLSQVANALKFNLYSDTYHKELVGIGDYDAIPAWQAAKSVSGDTAFNFKSASSISLTAEAAEKAGNEKEALLLDGIAMVIYAREAAGVVVDKRQTASTPSASRLTVNYFYHALQSTIVRASQPIVTLVIRD